MADTSSGAGSSGVGTAARSPRGAATRRAIYETAVRLFARNGFAATGVREIAREAEVNLAALNYAFGSKLGLLEAILDDFFTGYAAALEAAVAGAGSVEAKLGRAARAAAVYFGTERDKLLITITELPYDTPEITAFKARQVQKLVAVLQAEVLAGLDPAAAARLPLAVIGPAMTALAASHYLFRPVLEQAHPEGFEATASDRYPDIIAALFTGGLGALLAGAGGGDG